MGNLNDQNIFSPVKIINRVRAFDLRLEEEFLSLTAFGPCGCRQGRWPTSRRRPPSSRASRSWRRSTLRITSSTQQRGRCSVSCRCTTAFGVIQYQTCNGTRIIIRYYPCIHVRVYFLISICSYGYVIGWMCVSKVDSSRSQACFSVLKKIRTRIRGKSCFHLRSKQYHPWIWRITRIFL
jgi:hypothetical protein